MFFIVWGFRNRPKTIGEGEFFCGKCGADRHYVRQVFRRWFTLFWVPLFPTGKPLGDVVKCTTCDQAWKPEVLNNPTSSVLSESIKHAMRVAVVAILRTAADAGPAARAAAIAAVRGTGIEAYDDPALTMDLQTVDASQLAAYLPPLARGLTGQGKETFVTNVARVGAADGPLSPDEAGVLETIGAALGMSTTHLLGITTSVVDSAQPKTD